MAIGMPSAATAATPSHAGRLPPQDGLLAASSDSRAAAARRSRTGWSSSSPSVPALSLWTWRSEPHCPPWPSAAGCRALANSLVNMYAGCLACRLPGRCWTWSESRTWCPATETACYISGPRIRRSGSGHLHEWHGTWGRPSHAPSRSHAPHSLTGKSKLTIKTSCSIYTKYKRDPSSS